MNERRPALVVLKNGRSYAADEAWTDHGWVHAHGVLRRVPHYPGVSYRCVKDRAWPACDVQEVRWADQAVAA